MADGEGDAVDGGLPFRGGHVEPVLVLEEADGVDGIRAVESGAGFAELPAHQVELAGFEGGGEVAGAARAVVGIGLNVRMPPQAGDVIDQPWAELAGLSTHPPSRNAVVAALLARLLPALDDFDAHGLAPFLPRYAALDALAGRTLTVHAATANWPASALGIANDGALRVRDAAGDEHLVHAGDVSVRA